MSAEVSNDSGTTTPPDRASESPSITPANMLLGRATLSSLPPELQDMIWNLAVQDGEAEELDLELRDRVYLTHWTKAWLSDPSTNAGSTPGTTALPYSQLVPLDHHVPRRLTKLYCQVVLVRTPAPSGTGPLWNACRGSRRAVERRARFFDKIYCDFRARIEDEMAEELGLMSYIWVAEVNVAACSKSVSVRLCEVGYEWQPHAPYVYSKFAFADALSTSDCRLIFNSKNDQLDITPTIFRTEEGRQRCYGRSVPVDLDGFNRVAWVMQTPPESLDQIWSPTSPSIHRLSRVWAKSLFWGRNDDLSGCLGNHDESSSSNSPSAGSDTDDSPAGGRKLRSMTGARRSI